MSYTNVSNIYLTCTPVSSSSQFLFFCLQPLQPTHTRTHTPTHPHTHTLELCEVCLGVPDAIVIIPEVGGHGGEGLGTYQLPTVVKHLLTYRGWGYA